jgi:hypothetical protein
MRRAEGPFHKPTDAVGASEEHAENASTGAWVRHGLDKLLCQREAPLLQQKRAASARKCLEPCA